jgi:hypothetical protein
LPESLEWASPYLPPGGGPQTHIESGVKKESLTAGFQSRKMLQVFDSRLVGPSEIRFPGVVSIFGPFFAKQMVMVIIESVVYKRLPAGNSPIKARYIIALRN